MGLTTIGRRLLAEATGVANRQRTSRHLRSAPVQTFRDPFRMPVTEPDVLDLNPTGPVSCSTASGVRTTADRFGPPPPAGLLALRAAVAERTHSDPDAGTLITAGASGGYRTTLEAFVDPGRPVVLLAPCSPMFAQIAEVHRARVRWVRTWAEGGRLRLDFDALSRAMRGAALLAVADPGNPLGLPLADDDADRLRWTAGRSDVLVFVDESFSRFRDGPRQLAELAPERTVVAGSLAAYGHSALRVGWLIGPAPLVQTCELAQTLAGRQVPSVCQQLGWRVLMSESVETDGDAIRTARRDAVGRLRAMGLTVPEPTDGFFLWVDVGQNGRSFAEELLSTEGVRVGPGNLYGPGGERCIRLSVAGDSGRLREGLTRIARFVGAPTRPVPAARPTPARRPAFSRG